MYKKRMLIAAMSLALSSVSANPEPKKDSKFAKVKTFLKENAKTAGAVIGAGLLVSLGAAGLVVFGKKKTKQKPQENEAKVLASKLSENDNALAKAIATQFKSNLATQAPVVEAIVLNQDVCIKINLEKKDYLLLILAKAQKLNKTTTWKSIHKYTNRISNDYYVAQRGDCFYIKADNTANGFMIGLNIDEAKKGKLVVTKKYGNYWDYYKRTVGGVAAAGLVIGGTAYGLGYLSPSSTIPPHSPTPPDRSRPPNTCPTPTLEELVTTSQKEAQTPASDRIEALRQQFINQNQDPSISQPLNTDQPCLESDRTEALRQHQDPKYPTSDDRKTTSPLSFGPHESSIYVKEKELTLFKGHQDTYTCSGSDSCPALSRGMDNQVSNNVIPASTGKCPAKITIDSKPTSTLSFPPHKNSIYVKEYDVKGKEVTLFNNNETNTTNTCSANNQEVTLFNNNPDYTPKPTTLSDRALRTTFGQPQNNELKQLQTMQEQQAASNLENQHALKDQHNFAKTNKFQQNLNTTLSRFSK